MPHLAEPLPLFVPPALARAGELPGGEEWALEVKFDGCRGQLRWDGRRLSLRSRPGRDCTGSFPELAGLAGALPAAPLILDGELVSFDEQGHPDFPALRARLAGARGGRPVHFVVFDLLHLDGKAIRRLTLRDRRAALEALGVEHPLLRLSTPLDAPPAQALAIVAEHHLEGLVAKRWDGVYAEDRRRWIKHKVRREQRLWVTGWRSTSGRFGVELLLARDDDGGELVPAGSTSIVAPAAREPLERALAGAPHELGRGVRWLTQPLAVVVDGHGHPSRPLRDAVLREVLPATNAATAA